MDAADWGEWAARGLEAAGVAVIAGGAVLAGVTTMELEISGRWPWQRRSEGGG